MEIYLTKTMGGVLKPSFDSDYQKLKKLKLNKEYKCVITMPRNIKLHRKYFALLNLVFNNQESYSNIEDLRHDLTVAIGYYTLRENMQGDVIKKPNSIKFSSMDELEFGELYSKTIDAIVTHFNFNKQDIIDNVEQFF